MLGCDPLWFAEIVELDAALLPGLVDCHQHLCFEALAEDAAETPSDGVAAQAERSARRALAAGITTIHDLGDRDYVTLPLRGRDDLPTLLCSGHPRGTVGTSAEKSIPSPVSMLCGRRSGSESSVGAMWSRSWSRVDS